MASFTRPKRTKIDDGEALEFRSDGCKAVVYVYEDHANWVSLRSPGGEGWLDAAHEWAHKNLAGKTLYADPSDERAAESLRKRGWQDGEYNGKARLVLEA